MGRIHTFARLSAGGCRDAEMSENPAVAARSKWKCARTMERKKRPPDALTSHVQGQEGHRWGQ